MPSKDQRRNKYDSLAAIQYAGLNGITQECVDAVTRILQCGPRITRARVLTCSKIHAMLLTVDPGDLVAIKSGFASGYSGEGPRGFSFVLCLLHTHKIDIEEYEVDPELIEHLDRSALTKRDLKNLDNARPQHQRRWSEYVCASDWDRSQDGTLWNHRCESFMPLAIIDSRLIDLAMFFWENPDEKLLSGYRRLEDAVRKRIGINDHGAKLFSTAFRGDPPRLSWEGCHSTEQEGRASLFTGAFMAYRNPRAHRELKHYSTALLSEFLLLNQLFLLEKDAIEVGAIANKGKRSGKRSDRPLAKSTGA